MVFPVAMDLTRAAAFSTSDEPPKFRVGFVSQHVKETTRELRHVERKLAGYSHIEVRVNCRFRSQALTPQALDHRTALPHSYLKGKVHQPPSTAFPLVIACNPQVLRVQNGPLFF